ncbi:MAG: hypothetical protein SFW35_05555 [Chitinophagales bacterium]|nr:hypothetical protein [Chitinophagales bacterium]
MKRILMLVMWVPLFAVAQESPSEAQYKAKIDQLTKQIAANPSSPELYTKRADQIFMLNSIYPNQTGNYALTMVITDMDKAIELDANNPQLYALRGEYKRDITGDLAAAQADLSKAIELDPSNPTWYAQRSNYKGITGACMDWKKCAELGDGNCRVLNSQLCNK